MGRDRLLLAESTHPCLLLSRAVDRGGTRDLGIDCARLMPGATVRRLTERALRALLSDSPKLLAGPEAPAPKMRCGRPTLVPPPANRCRHRLGHLQEFQ